VHSNHWPRASGGKHRHVLPIGDTRIGCSIQRRVSRPAAHLLLLCFMMPCALHSAWVLTERPDRAGHIYSSGSLGITAATENQASSWGSGTASRHGSASTGKQAFAYSNE
jgi:hypothetical protein